ncbi:MAG: hypothetical protein J6Z04_03590 [Clostridia bacterium]|nr:hypothetical protein [Clostridia bacterium]
MKKLIPALALLLVSAVMLATSSFAWFSMNTTVTVTGMSVTTKASSNLLISATTTEEDFKPDPLTQTRNGILEPVSTIDGSNFFYTTDAKADGSKNKAITGAGAVPYVAYSEDATPAIVGTNSGKTTYDDEFNEAYQIGTVSTSNVAYGYIDYTVYLKATASERSKLLLSTVDLQYDGGAVTEKAWRVAVFAQSASTASGLTGSDTLVTILEPASAAYFDGTAVSGAAAKAAVNTKIDDEAVIDADVAANATMYYKVIVRLWLEGEDTTCNNETFADLTEDYTLDLTFDLKPYADAATGATVIS